MEEKFVIKNSYSNSVWSSVPILYNEKMKIFIESLDNDTEELEYNKIHLRYEYADGTIKIVTFKKEFEWNIEHEEYNTYIPIVTDLV
jgi:hypothetical protein